MAQSISNLYTAPKFKTQTSTAAVAKPSPLQWTPIPGAKANAYTGTGGLLNLTGSPTTATPSATSTPDPSKLTVGQTAPNLSNNFSINQGGILRNAPAPAASAPAAPSGNPPAGSTVSTGTPFAPTNTGVNALTGTTFDQNGTILNQGTQTPSSTGGVAPSPSMSAPGLIELLTKYAQGQGTQNPAIAQAQQDLLDTQNKIASLRQNAATAQGNEAQYDPSAINYKTGVQAELQNQEAAKETALQGQAQAQQAYAGNLLTAQQAGQTGINNALSAALTTTQAPYGTPLYQPGTNTFVNSTTQGEATTTPPGLESVWPTYVKEYASGQTGAIPSSILNNPEFAAKLQKAAEAQNPGFNFNTAQGQGQAQQATSAAQSQQVQTYKSSLQQGQNLQSQLKDLIKTFGLNPNDVNAANAGLQTIARNTSDPRYQLLNNYVNDIANTYAAILTPTGGSQTDTTRGIAASMLDATANGQSIITVMNGLDQAAQAKIAGVPTQGQKSSSGSFQEGQTTNSGGYNFVFQNGKWITK